MTLVDGSYRFRALGRGAYDLAFEIPGFRTLVREGVMVEGSRAIRIDAALELATVAESVTVSGAATATTPSSSRTRGVRPTGCR